MSPASLTTKSRSIPPVTKMVGNRTNTAAVLADRLRADIRDGMYPPGERFPSMRDLAAKTKMTYSAVIRAVEILQSEGLVEKHSGSKGTYVTDGSGSTNASNTGDPAATKSKRIGVVLPFWAVSTSHYVVSDILMGITGQAAQRQCRVELIHNTGDEAMAFGFVDEVMSLGLDGVIWVQPAPTHELNIARLIDRGVNVVATGRRFGRLPIATVHEDIHHTGELVAEHMAKRNSKELVVLSGPLTDDYSTDRIEAIRQALKNRGLELPDENICVAHTFAMDQNLPGQRSLEAAVNSFLVEHKGFDTVFALHPNHLGPLVKLHESGKRKCPDDFSLIHLSPACVPVRQLYPQVPIALIQWPLANIGKAAVCKLDGLWGNDSEPELSGLLPVLEEAEGAFR